MQRRNPNAKRAASCTAIQARLEPRTQVSWALGRGSEGRTAVGAEGAEHGCLVGLYAAADAEQSLELHAKMGFVHTSLRIATQGNDLQAKDAKGTDGYLCGTVAA